ncbi:MAG: cyclopropane fatty acyl phospholipid synthase [Parcubacteria group bacterium]|nr:cyclopropane fatty acyl phospholipid synthase [Parcubacteria group bacterium]
MSLKDQAQKILSKAGVTINGDKPWDIQVHDDRLYGRIFREGTIGLGEAYMDGWWDAPALDQFFERVIMSNAGDEAIPWIQTFIAKVMHGFFNRQSRARAFEVGEKHYDIGNDLYSRMLGKRMVYTCAYWKDAQTLDEAQEAKLDLICRKIGLKEGQRVLDIGCGWGSFAKFAAEKYGATVVGVTISVEQAKLARELCEGLPIEIRVQDYREVNEKFDHIVSIEMFEAVGSKNFREYMEVVSRCLKPGGLFLLQTIGAVDSSLATTTDAWVDRYIFPNGMLPSIAQIGKSIEGLLMVEDLHNFGFDYEKTLLAWNDNFQAAWPDLKEKYGDRFKRMWEYYLLQFVGAFRCRRNQDWQIVFSAKGVPGGYEAVR